ncbi:MAG TPA: sucrase ferredoxin [Mycobacteriales bacterium]|nr:sucrase ferredoxin [Mycobacteriales bacterium]
MTTCTALSRRLGVEPAGTAPWIRSWLLLEVPGAWGEDVRDTAFAAALGPERWTLLRTLWETQWLRPLVVRRPGRAGRGRCAEPVLFVGSTVGGRWLERLPASALAWLDLEAVAAGAPGHGAAVDGPLFAVCTNGSVDRCCAVRGRPLVTALAAEHPERTWEVSHVGGCQFAANLLVLPDAAVHGRLTPEDGLRIAAAALDGRVDVEHLRGTCGHRAFSGVAEVALRRRLGLTAWAGVEVIGEHPHDDLLDGEDGPEPAGADVLLRAGGGTWRAVARARPLGEATSVCDGTSSVTTTALVDLDRG